MGTLLIFHEVDDVEHWLASPKRAEAFGPLGISVRTFVEPANVNLVGLIAEVPDMEALHAMLASEVGAEAMRHDGVRPETVVMCVES